ncbi:MAG: toprim domain-containing protein [Fibrobacteraceae bacterium]|nr:toprim domain-containing protein [Fibrobacteraceae bacterium]
MTSEELKQFKASISITAVAKALGKEVVRGKCKCFFPNRHVHGDRTPSVSISEERGTFRCWVCDDVRGDVIELVKLERNCSFMDAVAWLQNEYGFLAPKENLRDRVDGSKRLVPQNFEEVFRRKEQTKEELVPEEERKKIILNFLKKLSPVDDTAAVSYLAKRRIYKPVWDKMLLRVIKDYDGLNRCLKEEYSLDVLKYVGLFNDKGNLRYYKHPLIFPYLDSKNRAFYFQARAIDSSVVPKELNLTGLVPYPYNVSLLNEKHGWVYLCEGVIDTLTFVGRNIPAIGIPGVRSFKMEWLPLFKNKNVVLCLDKDEAGYRATEYLKGVFEQAGIQCITLGAGLENLSSSIKDGQDINDWFGGRK